MDLKDKLEQLYMQYNTREHVYSDPIAVLYAYDRIKDREIVALVTACLAYGRVASIQKSVARVLSPMGVSPHAFLMQTSKAELAHSYKGFVHRFAKAHHLVGLLWGIKKVILKFGSLENCMMQGITPDGETILPALCRFSEQIIGMAGHDPGHLVSLPGRGSASKRLHLFLRWMVRQDAVDPGGWQEICPSMLLIPLDVHMHRISTLLQFTRKKQADLKTALEITQCFKAIAPLDPVKYDFALTRLGIEGHGLDVLTCER